MIFQRCDLSTSMDRRFPVVSTAIMTKCSRGTFRCRCSSNFYETPRLLQMKQARGRKGWDDIVRRWIDKILMNCQVVLYSGSHLSPGSTCRQETWPTTSLFWWYHRLSYASSTVWNECHTCCDERTTMPHPIHFVGHLHLNNKTSIDTTSSILLLK